MVEANRDFGLFPPPALEQRVRLWARPTAAVKGEFWPD